MDKATRKSSFGQWISFLDVERFQEIVHFYQGDKYVKKLDTWSLLRIFLLAQIRQFKCLRDIEVAVLNNNFLQAELGLKSISASQLSRSCARLNPEIFRMLFLDLVKKAQVAIHRDRPYWPLLGLIKIIDSTTIPLCLSTYEWAKFRKTKAGVKVHTRIALVDPDHSYPDDLRITPASVADTNELSVLVDDPEAMYVFDRGYLDYERFDQYCDDGIRFTTRLKENAVYDILCETFDDYESENEKIIRDSWVRLGTNTKRMRHELRRIVTSDTHGKTVVILTNDLFTPATEITELYRNRWQIELFFKWMKQHLKLTAMFGQSPNAVENQIYMAMIAYLLLFLTRAVHASNKTMLDLQRLLRELLWKPWSTMQKALKRKPTRTSKGRQVKRE